MKILVDLQGAQSDSRFRGIGRFSRSFCVSLARNAGAHDVFVLLNSAMPGAIPEIKRALHGLIPEENFVIFRGLSETAYLNPANEWRRRASEYVREALIEQINPDVLLLTSLFEGFGDDAIQAFGDKNRQYKISTIVHDLIPLIQEEVYLTPNPVYEEFYKNRISLLKKCDLLLSVSESSRQECIAHLGSSKDSVVNIKSGVSDEFASHNEGSIFSDLAEKLSIKGEFILYLSAGDERKNQQRLIEAYATLPGEVQQRYQLVLAGGAGEPVLNKFRSIARKANLADERLVITGHVTDDEIISLYKECSLFVFPSTHEGFGLPVLEAMTLGAPVIGSNTSSVPEVIGRDDALFNPFSVDDIALKMLEFLTSTKKLQDLKSHAKRQSKKFSLESTAKAAITALEKLDYSATTEAGYRVEATIEDGLLNSVYNLRHLNPAGSDLIEISLSANMLFSSRGKNKLFVDVSILHGMDAKTGIQRVVRSILMAMLNFPDFGYEIRPVYSFPGAGCYYYADNFVNNFLNYDNNSELVDQPIDYKSGDIFFGLDLSHHNVIEMEDYFHMMRLFGVKCYFEIYDLLPISMTEYFAEGMYDLHSSWLRVLSGMDGVICISRTVADEFAQWVVDHGDMRREPVKIGYAHIGADISASLPTRGMPDKADALLKDMDRSITFLLVGTVEPRKGYDQVLEAFNALWREGVDVRLCIIGKAGWKVDALVHELRRHTERGKRLFWFEKASDEFLQLAYKKANCLIVASYGEGFGLPLVEAAQYNLPVLARDLPVFNEVAGDHAVYFRNGTHRDMVDGVKAWLEKNATGTVPSSKNIPNLTWEQSARAALDVMIKGAWYKEGHASKRRKYLASDSRLYTIVGERKAGSLITTGQNGFLLYGPYIRLSAGRLRVTINGTVEELGTIVVDGAANSGKLKLFDKTLSAADVYPQGVISCVEFDLYEDCSRFEVRIQVTEHTNISIASIEIESL